MEQAPVFGVKERNVAGSEAEACAEEIRLAGWSLLAGVIDADQVASLRAKLDATYERQLAELGGRERLAKLGDTWTAMCLLAYDDEFARLAAHPRVLAVLTLLLGDYHIVMLQNGIINVPEVGHQQTPGHWHRDLGYQHFVSSRPLGVTALLCLDAFDEITGGTRLLPSSHKSEAFPTDAYVARHEVGVTAPAGSIVLFDAMLYHRAGHNRSTAPRRAVNTTYTVPLIKQQIALPRMLGGRFADDAQLRRLFGYDSDPADSVLEFRQRRLQRAGAG